MAVSSYEFIKECHGNFLNSEVRWVADPFVEGKIN